MAFIPDYMNILDAAYNRAPKRLPLYEHLISGGIMEKVLGRKFCHLWAGTFRDKEEYFTHFCEFFRFMGYDAVSFECCICPAMPNSGLLGGGGNRESVIQSYRDFERYPWDEIPVIFFKMYGKLMEALRNVMPAGMKAVGGVGNGVFECVQDVIGYENLAYISADDPELYTALFNKVGEVSLRIWERFMADYGDVYCVLRFGDDLGFKTSTLISAEDIRNLVIPQYARIINCVHSYSKPFLLHSCGNIFSVMPEMINIAKINAKHSNEDSIAPFSAWVKEYGKDIGNFGGIDTDDVCRLSLSGIRERVTEILDACKGGGGIAFSTGNSIPDYVPVDNYVEMVNAVRRYRGDF